MSVSQTRALKSLLALVILLAAIYLAASIYIADRALAAEVKPLTERPNDVGLAYEDVRFAPRDWPDLRLRGWWLPAPEPRGAVIRVHGLDGNRSALLGLSAALTRAGFSVLAFDLRGHGESDRARMGAGLHERDDVLGAVDYVVQQQGVRPGRVFLHGNSYGAAISLMAGWREEAVAGVFADSAFASLSDLVAQEVAQRTVVPSWLASTLRPGIVFMGRLIHGIDINDIQPALDAARYRYPLGLTHCRPDDRITIVHFERIASAVQFPPISRVFDGCEHSDAWLEHSASYEALVIAYFERRLANPNPVATN